jgi:hypothetical protein
VKQDSKGGEHPKSENKKTAFRIIKMLINVLRLETKQKAKILSKSIPPHL